MRGTLVYGETLDSFPAQIYNEELPEGEGFATDLMNQLALEMETAIDFLPLDWPDVFETLESGKTDMIQISYSEERAEKYYLTEPLYESKGVVFVREDGEVIRELKDLEGKRVAGIKEDYALSVLKEKIPDLKIQEYNNIDECARALKKGTVDGIVADEQNIMYYAQKWNMFQNYYVVEEAVYNSGVVFAVRKEDEKLGKIINKAVCKMRISGILDKLQQKWFLKSILRPVISDKEMDSWIIQGIAGTLILISILFWNIQTGTRAIVVEKTKELVRERGRLEMILQSIPQYLLEVNTDGELFYVSQKQKIKFKSEEEWDFVNLEKELLKRYDKKKITEVFEGGTYQQEEVQINDKWYRITIGGIEEKRKDKRKDSPKENKVLMVIEDITLYRLQEKQSIQNSKMAAIGQLASGISHELKNPLEIICNYCYAIKKGILHTEEQIKKTIEVIDDEAKSANKIVNNLLSFARITPEKIELTEMKPFVQMILELQKNFMKKRNIKTEFVCEEKIFIRCNPEVLKRIFINLIRNAQDAIGENGIIKIMIKQEKEHVQIVIQDNGCGMDERDQEQIFNPFYTTKSTGTGLGLYLVYHQVQESSGTIHVSSSKGEGTTFRLIFPADTEVRE